MAAGRSQGPAFSYVHRLEAGRLLSDEAARPRRTQPARGGAVAVVRSCDAGGESQV